MLYSIISTPIGPLMLTGDKHALTGLHLPGRQRAQPDRDRRARDPVTVPFLRPRQASACIPPKHARTYRRNHQEPGGLHPADP